MLLYSSYQHDNDDDDVHEIYDDDDDDDDDSSGAESLWRLEKEVDGSFCFIHTS